MRGIYVDNGTAFVTDEEWKQSQYEDTGVYEDGDMVCGGSASNCDVKDVLQDTRRDVNYNHFEIGLDYITIVDRRSTTFRIGGPLNILWENALDKEVRDKIDAAMMKYMDFEDDIWDSSLSLKQGEFYASNLYDALVEVVSIIKTNINDTSLITYICGRVCFYKTLKKMVPDYVYCIDPVKMSKLTLRYALDMKEVKK